MAPGNAVAQETVRAIEAILMVAQESVPAQLIAELVEIPVAQVDEICGTLASVYADAGHGFEIAKIAGGWRYQSHPDLAHYVERFILDGQRARLSGAALETLAIIAYKQPISRLQIASIRGVDPEAVMRTLHGRGYIAPVGRDSGPGQAVMWGTTPLFLDKLGLASLEDMPAISTFVPDASLVEALEKTLRLGPDLESGADDASASPDGD
ncbi:MAG: SMC-Scp complex subunit ScpB [Actinomycetota bacterium]